METSRKKLFRLNNKNKGKEEQIQIQPVVFSPVLSSLFQNNEQIILRGQPNTDVECSCFLCRIGYEEDKAMDIITSQLHHEACCLSNFIEQDDDNDNSVSSPNPKSISFTANNLHHRRKYRLSDDNIIQEEDENNHSYRLSSSSTQIITYHQGPVTGNYLRIINRLILSSSPMTLAVNQMTIRLKEIQTKLLFKYYRYALNSSFNETRSLISLMTRTPSSSAAQDQRVSMLSLTDHSHLYHNHNSMLLTGQRTLQQRHNLLHWVSWEWVFVLTNLTLEILMVIFDQIASPHKPQYALVAVVVSLAAMFICVTELIHKGLKQSVTLRRRGINYWFHCPSSVNKPCYTFIDAFNLVCAISQFIFSTFAYSCFRRGAENPIKVSIISLIFILCLTFSKLFNKTEEMHLPIRRRDD